MRTCIPNIPSIEHPYNRESGETVIRMCDTLEYMFVGSGRNGYSFDKHI